MARLRVRKSVASAWKTHKKNWCDCERCPLHADRTKVVLARGEIPCDLLFIGEGPGESEDIGGYPFIGPAGGLLDTLIDSSFSAVFGDEKWPIVAFANILACIPWDKDSEGSMHGVRAPKAKEAEACSHRLRNFINRIAKPRHIVTLGVAPAKFAKLSVVGIPTSSLIHPSAILYMEEDAQPLAIKKFRIGLTTVLERL
jgi:uracil-DNA glycosylase family 4